MIGRRIAYRLLQQLLTRVAGQRPPDFVVGVDNPQGAYLRRWYLVPRNKLLNVYLHQFLRDDDDRALHDHPWPWLSFLLCGRYVEHTIAAGGIHRRALRTPGSLKVSGPWRAHRVELLPLPSEHGPADWRAPCWTLFITGPRIRRWGFHCAEQGWVDYARFTRPGAVGETGPGCDG